MIHHKKLEHIIYIYLFIYFEERENSRYTKFFKFYKIIFVYFFFVFLNVKNEFYFVMHIYIIFRSADFLLFIYFKNCSGNCRNKYNKKRKQQINSKQ